MTGEFDNYNPHQPVLERCNSDSFESLMKTLIYRNRMNEPWVRQRARPRRNRKSEIVRAMVRENIVTPKYAEQVKELELILMRG